jgi:hypothetical protein
MSDESTGVLVVHVYRAGKNYCVYLDQRGAHPNLELAANMSPGGDWCEAMIYHEQEPPYPPDAVGLYELTMPWREPIVPTDEEKADPDYESSDDESHDGEICCLFEPPSWRLVFPAGRVPSATPESFPDAEEGFRLTNAEALAQADRLAARVPSESPDTEQKR